MAAEKLYRGTRVPGARVARVMIYRAGQAAQLLPMRLDLFNHSPAGLEWGYGGSGPAQLALALLADATGDDNLAVKLHQSFKWAIIASLHRDHDWEISADAIQAWCRNVNK